MLPLVVIMCFHQVMDDGVADPNILISLDQ